MAGKKAAAAAREAGGKGHYLGPVAAVVGAFPLALTTHLVWGTDGTMEGLLGAAGALLTVSTWGTWTTRHPHTRMMATAYTALIAGWVEYATVHAPWSHSVLNAWAFGLLLLPTGWWLRHHGIATGHANDRAAGRKDGLLSKIPSLKNGKVETVEEDPETGRMTAKVQLKKGGTAADVQSERDRIASVAKVGAEQVTVRKVSGRADKVELEFQLADHTAEPVEWEGPSAPGKSVADAPLRIGKRANGSYVEPWMCGNPDPRNPRQAGHFLVTGINGSGKTETVKTLIIDLLSRRDAVAVVGDPEKFAQSFGEIAHALAGAADGPDQVRRLLKNLPNAIRYRASVLGSLTRLDGTRGYGQWEPECWTLHGIPVVFVDIEEAASALESGDDDFDKAVRTARSVGIVLCASLQTAPFNKIPRETRGQFTNSLAHGCREDQDAKFSLSPHTREAGADPTKWANNFAGAHFAELVGTDPAEWSMDARAFYLDRQTKLLELERSRQQRAVLDEGTAMHLLQGIRMPDVVVHAIADNPPKDSPEIPESTGEPEDEDVLSTVYITEEGKEIDVSQPIPKSTGPSIPLFLSPESPMSTEDARRTLEEAIDALESDGKNEVTFADLGALPAKTGLTRQWVYKQLKRLEAEGRLEAINGKPPYRILPRVALAGAVNGHRFKD